MTNVRDQLYHRHCFPAEIIAEAVWTRWSGVCVAGAHPAAFQPPLT
ncbi:MAG: hypothetical protein AAAC48_22090 [Phyllobacterium sp.]